MLAVSNSDYLAALIVVCGMVCQLWHRRLPPGLGTSLLAAGTTVGVGIACGTRTWALPLDKYLWFRVSAGLCLTWGVFGWMAAHSDSRAEASGVSSPATFWAWAMVTGVAAAVQAAYLLVFNTWYRVVEAETLGQGLLWQGALWDLGALFAAVLLWRSTVRRPAQPVIMLSLSAVMIWWTSLTIPAAFGAYGERQAETGLFRPAWWDWTFHLQFSLALLLVGAAVIQDVGYRSRRKFAWPDRLDELLAPYSRWPGYVQVESTIAASILILGVYQLVRLGSPSVLLGLVSAVSCGIAGATCLYMTYRRWSGNTASVGMGLLTLSVVVLFSTLGVLLLPSESSEVYSSRMPAVFNSTLAALATMLVLWRWLARVWRQQLLEGVAWTTAGRLIPLARQTSFLLGALAVLVSFQLALWPRSFPTEDYAGGSRQGVAGVMVIAASCLVVSYLARRDQKTTTAGLAVSLAGATVLYLFVRMPTSNARGWLVQYDEVVLACCALPILVLTEALSKTKWRCFAGPLWLVALLVLPMWSMRELLRPALPAEWVRPMVLAVLGALYSFAGSREHRRSFLVLGGVLLVASMTSLYRIYG